LPSGDGLSHGNGDVVHMDELVFNRPLPVLALDVDLVGCPVGGCSDLANLRDRARDGRGYISPRASTHPAIEINATMGAITPLVASLRAEGLTV
jgi:hypothetical protein